MFDLIIIEVEISEQRVEQERLNTKCSWVEPRMSMGKRRGCGEGIREGVCGGSAYQYMSILRSDGRKEGRKEGEQDGL